MEHNEKKPPVTPTPVSHLVFGDPKQPKDQWGSSFAGYKGRTPAHAGARWTYMPWVYAIGLMLFIGWPFLFHGVARIVCAIIWYPLAVLIGVAVLRAQLRKEKLELSPIAKESERAALLRKQNDLLAEQNNPASTSGKKLCPGCKKPIEAAPPGSRVPFVHTATGDFAC